MIACQDCFTKEALNGPGLGADNSFSDLGFVEVIYEGFCFVGKGAFFVSYGAFIGPFRRQKYSFGVF